ncbi:MAG: Coenzyme F420 hydrogenase/dehydrogenase, beta subunit C-terminal domain [Methanomicrobiales archaeon]|nr:Coenzyme F420 hydrogenase/dehydrogenase, beta subunit C-terminal domain [Methanomicrobiales archaeon]
MAKTYQDLKKEVWDEERCAGCGACVAVCPADAFSFTPGESHPRHTEYCKEATDGVPCGACYQVCPRVVPVPVDQSLVGTYLHIRSARAGFDVPGRQSGGAVTALLLHALESGYIDAVVTVTEDRWTHRPSSAIITSTTVLLSQAGSRYNWWVPLMASLKEAVITRKYRSIAVVGVPCVVEAAKRIRDSENTLLRPFRRSIRFVIGLFCTESFDYQRLVEGKLTGERNIEPWQIRRFEVKGNLDLTLNDGTTLTLPLSELGECVRSGCHICTDFTSLHADVSAGAVGSESGYTTLITRTAEGEGLVCSALQSGRLMAGSAVDLKAIERLAAKKRKRMPE